MNDPRALLVCEDANPEWQSVPLLGWSHSQAIARRLDAHLVTHIRCRDALLRAGLVEGTDFTAIDSEAISRPMWKLTGMLRGGEGKGFTTVMAISGIAHWYFERLVFQRFQNDLKSGRFNIVHRITPMSPTVVSPMAKWCEKLGVPFVLGPLNGGLPWPREFDDLRKREKEYLAKVRGIYRYTPGFRTTRKCSRALLIGSRATYNELPTKYRDKAFYMPENAIDPARFTARRERTPRLPLKLLFVGRLVPFKNADVAIEAAAELLRNGDAELTIIGSGPDEAKLQQIAHEQNVASRITFIPNIPHAELQNHYADADVFVFPSVRELGGAVVIEAMMLGAVPLVVDYGGPPEFLTASSGLCVPLGERRTIVESLRRKLTELAASPETLVAMSAAAMRRAREQFTWDRKAELDEQIYRWILYGEPKPVMPIPDCGELCRESPKLSADTEQEPALQSVAAVG